MLKSNNNEIEKLYETFKKKRMRLKAGILIVSILDVIFLTWLFTSIWNAPSKGYDGLFLICIFLLFWSVVFTIIFLSIYFVSRNRYNFLITSNEIFIFGNKKRLAIKFLDIKVLFLGTNDYKPMEKTFLKSFSKVKYKRRILYWKNTSSETEAKIMVQSATTTPRTMVFLSNDQILVGRLLNIVKPLEKPKLMKSSNIDDIKLGRKID